MNSFIKQILILTLSFYPNLEVKCKAVRKLGDSGDTSVVPSLIDALSNKLYGVRSSAAEALGKLGDTSAVPSLINALSDSDEWVRSGAGLVVGPVGRRLCGSCAHHGALGP